MVHDVLKRWKEVMQTIRFYNILACAFPVHPRRPELSENVTEKEY